MGASAVAQQDLLQNQLIGSWSLVSTRTTRPDGSVYAPYGPHETGTLVFERNGQFALILINPDIPKYASNNREQPTSEEALAAAKGSFAFFGTYSVNEPDRTFVFHVKASSFPNFNGTDQKRIVKSITADELVFQNMAPPNAGARVELIYRRDK
jgi:hypothetical protein